MNRKIDFHTHLEEKWFSTPLMNAEEFIAGLDECAVEAACIFTINGFYSDCPKANDELVRQARQYPDRLIPFCTVDPKIGTAACREVERCLENPLFRGLKFHPWAQSFAPSMVRETLTDILKIAAAHDVPVLFHDGTPPYSTTLQIAATARWVPEAKIVLGHGGLADYVFQAGKLLRDLPNLYACTCCPKAGDIAYLVECAGEDRVIFGTDYGVANVNILKERLEDVMQSGLSGLALDKVLYGNAARLLHLEERPL